MIKAYVAFYSYILKTRKLITCCSKWPWSL